MPEASPIFMGYRKLFALVVACVCATLLQALGKFDTEIALFLASVYAAYVGGNVGEYFARARQTTSPIISMVSRGGGFVAEATAPRNITPAMMKAIQSGMTVDDIEALVRDVAGTR